mgnify:FL=1
MFIIAVVRFDKNDFFLRLLVRFGWVGDVLLMLM